MLLRMLNPETAHRVALWALRNNLGPRQRIEAPGLRTRLLGKTLINPIGLAAGAEKRGEALAGWVRMGFGMIEAGTVTQEARAGNPKPRVWRVGEGGVVNWMGLPGDGLEPFVANLKLFHNTAERHRVLLGASVSSPEGEVRALREIATRCSPWVDYLALNVSCPNLDHATDTALHGEIREQVRAVVDGGKGKPVLVKLGPTLEREVLEGMLESVMQSGASGVILTNTLPALNKEWLDQPPPIWPQHGEEEVGGYSGPGLLPIAQFMVRESRSILGGDATIIGVGGIHSGDDARQMINAGANAIQLYSGLIRKGPKLLQEIARALA